jgi:hypothetical protein
MDIHGYSTSLRSVTASTTRSALPLSALRCPSSPSSVPVSTIHLQPYGPEQTLAQAWPERAGPAQKDLNMLRTAGLVPLKERCAPTSPAVLFPQAVARGASTPPRGILIAGYMLGGLFELPNLHQAGACVGWVAQGSPCRLTVTPAVLGSWNLLVAGSCPCPRWPGPTPLCVPSSAEKFAVSPSSYALKL